MSEQSSRGSAWQRVRLFVLGRDAWTCAYCRKHLEGDDATVDHIVAKANGGGDNADNLVACCRSCNGRKSDGNLPRINWTNPIWL